MVESLQRVRRNHQRTEILVECVMPNLCVKENKWKRKSGRDASRRRR